MSYTEIRRSYSITGFLVLVALAALAASGCTTAGTSTTNSTNSNANPPTANTPVGGTALETREPERYSITNTITIQPTGNTPQANVSPMQFSFAKMGTDRRVSEQAGTDTVNGRTTVKYRFKGTADTHTRVGTAQADSIVYVDQETGLPLRSEIDTSSSSGAGARIVTVADSLQFAPDASLFEVPNAMKKVTSAELKQQVQSFVAAVRGVANYLRNQISAPAPAARQR